MPKADKAGVVTSEEAPDTIRPVSFRNGSADAWVGGRRRAVDEGARQVFIEAAGEIRMVKVDTAIDHAHARAPHSR